MQHEELSEALKNFPGYHTKETSEPTTPRQTTSCQETKQGLIATPDQKTTPNSHKLERAPGRQDQHIFAHTFQTAVLDAIRNNPKTNPEQKFEELAKLYQKAGITISEVKNYKISYLLEDIKLLDSDSLSEKYKQLIISEINRKAEDLLVDISRDFITEFHKKGESTISVDKKRNDDKGKEGLYLQRIDMALMENDDSTLKTISTHIAFLFDANNDGTCGGEKIQSLNKDRKFIFLKEKISFHLYLIRTFLKENTDNDDLYNKIYEDVINEIIKKHIPAPSKKKKDTPVGIYSDVDFQRLAQELKEGVQSRLKAEAGSGSSSEAGSGSSSESASGPEAKLQLKIKRDNTSSRIVIPSLPRCVADFINNTQNANTTLEKVEQIINNLKELGLIKEEDPNQIKTGINKIIEEHDAVETNIQLDATVDHGLKEKLIKYCKNNKSDSISKLIADTLSKRTTTCENKNDFIEFTKEPFEDIVDSYKQSINIFFAQIGERYSTVDKKYLLRSLRKSLPITTDIDIVINEIFQSEKDNIELTQEKIEQIKAKYIEGLSKLPRNKEKIYTEDEIMSLSIDVLALGGNERYQSEQIIKFIQALQRHAKGKLSEENAIILSQLCKLHIPETGIEPNFNIRHLSLFFHSTGSDSPTGSNTSTGTGDTSPSSCPNFPATSHGGRIFEGPSISPPM